MLRLGALRAIASFALLLVACKASEPPGDPLLAPGTRPCVDAKKRVRTSATWEPTDKGLALHVRIEARPEASLVKLDSEPRLEGGGTLVPRKVTEREVVVDVVTAPMTGHIEILVPNQLCDGGQESGAIRVICTWRGDPSLRPPIETALGSTGLRGG